MKPSSSPTTVKMKSVCCSGTYAFFVSVPLNKPEPRRPPVTIADLRLLEVVLGLRLVAGGFSGRLVEEARDAVDLVGVERAGRRSPRRPR